MGGKAAAFRKMNQAEQAAALQNGSSRKIQPVAKKKGSGSGDPLLANLCGIGIPRTLICY
jgi:hypothetical protein